MANANEKTLVKETVGNDYDYFTDADLSALQYCFVKIDTDELLVACGAGEVPIGILQNAPNGSVKRAIGTVRLFGASKLKLGGTIVPTLPYIKSDGSSLGVACASNKDAYGAIAKSGGVSGDYLTVLVQNGIYNA